MVQQLLLVFISLGVFLAQGQIVNSEILDANNVSAYIHDEGGFFNRPSNATAGYEVPKGGGVSTIFAGSFWIGAQDVNGELRFSGKRYSLGGSNSGFHSGPIAESIAYGSINYSNQYQQAIWRVSKTEIVNHMLNFNNSGYTIPSSIADWPGNGDVLLGVASQLAPFIDLNNNGLYEPASGEYPDIRGTEAVYVIMNDASYQPDGNQLGVELHAMFYQNVSGSYEQNATQLNVRVFNRSNVNYYNYRQGLYIDFDIGGFADDYLGCAPSNHVCFGYNGDDIDESNGGSLGYGTNPPCQGVAVLSHDMAGFCAFNNGQDYGDNDTLMWLLLNNQWGDSSYWINPLTGNLTDFIFSGNPNVAGTWHESAVNNTAGDRRGLITIREPFLPAGGSICSDYVFIYDRMGQNRLENVQRVIDIAGAWRNGYNVSNTYPCQTSAFNSVSGIELNPTLKIVPNPAGDLITISHPFGNQQGTLTILTLDGKSVFEQEVQEESHYFLPSLENGVYVVVLKVAGRQVQERLVIEH
jgi:hypothetical protein